MTATAEQLRALVKEATRGPWEHIPTKVATYDVDLVVAGGFHIAKQMRRSDARLIALAPQLAELVADMGEVLEAMYRERYPRQEPDTHEPPPMPRGGSMPLPVQLGDQVRATLARFGALFPKTPICDHEWVDARNEVVESGEMCVKCHAIRAASSPASISDASKEATDA